APLALRMGLPFVPVRKVGKLPGDTEKVSYALEYGEATIEIHRDALRPGQKVLVVDDLLATGGTAIATLELIDRLGAETTAIAFVIELDFLEGRSKLPAGLVDSLIHY
ncbi:MAG: adenine phosphoribosyltransferase, partial [Myxococcota bacterium]|nr:adenine phosphoribosyltransferase [Myxococcota bacterium]